MPRILITGATGLIGYHAALLWRERGWHVRTLVRPESDISRLEELRCEFVVGNVTRPETLAGSAADCEVVLHAAALVFGDGRWESHRRVNVDGTRHVVDEALRSGTARFIHVSSVAVYGSPSRHSRPITEQAPADLALPPAAHYGRSKQMAERVVREIPPGRLGWTMLRPTVVMGEEDRNFTPRVLATARLPVLPLIGAGESDIPIVYAGNVALAAWRAARAEEARGGVYNVTDDGHLSQRDLLTLAGARLLVPIPAAVARAGAAVVEKAFSVLSASGRLPLAGRAVEFMADGDPYSDARLRTELGWEPAVSTREGWERAVRWAGERHRAGNPSPQGESETSGRNRRAGADEPR